MAITLLQPLSAGNAIRVFITPEAGALSWRVLRRTADVWTGPDDDGAVLVADASDDNCLLDTTALVNGIAYFYRAWSWTGAAWIASPSMQATPAATYAGDAADPPTILVERLAAGLAVEVARGALAPECGRIPVFKAPFVAAEHLSFPNVIVHLDQVAPADRFIGDDGLGLDHLPGGGWTDHEGFLARWSINIAGVAQSADERHDLRQALQRILLANLSVFAAGGLLLPEWSFGDTEDLQDKNVALFMTGGTFSCQSHSFVTTGVVPEIADVTVTPTFVEAIR